jgi:alkanesulfonate monooxygenase SsuD/methylene tetrahydromethanopterin reductase-like flavin-dependent oxidoreductase (luciferase family)
VVAFMRGTMVEDQSYGMNPSESRERLMEAMELVLKALTEPQPFSWEGRYFRFPTVSVWPRPVQQPLPPILVASRSDEALRFAADHRLGLAIPYDRVDDTAPVFDKYRQWCQEAGWEPQPDQFVYRGSIYITETDQEAQDWLDRRRAAGVTRSLSLQPSVAQAVQSALGGQSFDPYQVVAEAPRRDPAREARSSITFLGSPDTIVKKLEEFHERCGVGVVDFGFQQPGISHQEVMRELELFGKEVLPQMHAF